MHSLSSETPAMCHGKETVRLSQTKVSGTGCRSLHHQYYF